MADFEGTWDTEFGELEVEIVGNQLSGEYGNHDGELEGIVGGNCANGTWWQRAADGKGSTGGRFSIQLRQNGDVFVGTYTYDGQPATEQHQWKGTRTK